MFRHLFNRKSGKFKYQKLIQRKTDITNSTCTVAQNNDINRKKKHINSLTQNSYTVVLHRTIHDAIS